MMSKITTIGFDADDTLWENEQYFRMTEAQFADLLDEYADPEHIAKVMLDTERRNLKLYGYGIKGFTLSMIETALDVTNDRVETKVIRKIIDLAHDMFSHPIEPLPHVRETLAKVANDYRILVITKGDLFDQERKLASSGLGDFFDGIEIVSEKRRYTYQSIFAQHGEGAEHAVMVGNSLKSDIIPALEAGSWGLYVPHHTTWEMEHAEEPVGERRYRKLENISQVPDIINELTQLAA
jgi:putative hydrolase of the HAD superfamily